MILQTAVFLSFIIASDSYWSPGSPLWKSCSYKAKLRLSPLYGNSADGWESDDVPLDHKNLPKIDSTAILALDRSLGGLVTQCAIGTVSYYMLEFHDEATQHWLVSFQNYSKTGFQDGNWEGFLEDMIKTDTQTIEVLLNPPKQLRRGRHHPQGNNIRVRYVQELEPRKIANQLVAVREDISGEIMRDLGSIRLENAASVKFANMWITKDRKYAEEHRDITRSQDSGSTPLRFKNFCECSLLVTNVALELIRKDLEKKERKSELAAIDSVIVKIEDAINKADPLQRRILQAASPRTLVEELCYLGLTESMKEKTAADSMKPSGAVMAVAQKLMDTRMAVALEACRILSTQSLYSRQYYKLIKDCGGFKKFDFKKPEVSLVDLDAEKRSEEQQQKENNSKTTENLKESSTEVSYERKKEEKVVLTEIKESVDSKVETEKEEVELFDVDLEGFGPMFM